MLSDPWMTVVPKPQPDMISPGGAMVYHLIHVPGGALSRVVVQPGMVSTGGRLEGIEDTFFILSGTGQIWRCESNGPVLREETVALRPGVTVTIPSGVAFQYRSHPEEPLVFLEIVAPGWSLERRLPSEHRSWVPTYGKASTDATPDRDPSHVACQSAGEASWETTHLDALVPTRRLDGFDVRGIADSYKGLTLRHLVLAAGNVSASRARQDRHEIWIVLNGVGTIWRESGRTPNVTGDAHAQQLTREVTVDVPAGVKAQFAAGPSAALEMLMMSVRG